MIIVRLNGGLGNQMFQYAAGRAAAIRVSDKLKLDVSTFEKINTNTPRSYALGVFNIVENFAPPNEILGLTPSFFSKKFGFPKKSYLFEKEGSLSSLSNIPKDAYLDGYWQSEKYFKDKEDFVRADFTPKNPLSSSALKMQTNIQKVNAISVHIRRGDYAQNPITHAYHGTCSPEYYQKAISYIREKIINPSFFVFSDDIMWVKENISFENEPTFYVSDYNIHDYEELLLMSTCKHHIIANSTFSWWGAWLNPSKNKIVIAPQKWSIKNNPENIVPSSWLLF